MIKAQKSFHQNLIDKRFMQEDYWLVWSVAKLQFQAFVLHPVMKYSFETAFEWETTNMIEKEVKQQFKRQ